MGKTQLERYEELGIEESLGLPYRYPIVCRELSSILRGAYSKLPKNIQSLLFQHSLSAFRLLPLMQTQRAVAAANVLIHSAEAVLPKQKKVVAVKEFKHAKVSLKRRCKDRQEKGPPQLPHDVLVHIFSFLDLRSLLSASSICWAWNSAASDDHLWNLLYSTCFGDTHFGTNSDWRRTFKETYEGSSVEKFLFDRGFCEQCDAIVWLSNMNCPNKHGRMYSRTQQLKPVSPEQIMEYVLNGTPYILASFESDSDYSDDESLSKLWASHRFLVQ